MGIIQNLKDVILIITKFLSPPYCVGCESLLPDYTVLCSACKSALPKIFSLNIQLSPARSLVLHAYTAYQQPCDKLIQAKLSGQRLPIFQLSRLLADYVKELTLECDIIVPIPLHWQRKMWRGFNQAEILAESVAKILNKPLCNALVRHKKTAFQSALSAAERKENVTNVFVLDKKLLPQVKNRRILLIDDLYTTGATVRSAALELYKHGAQSVEVLVACKVMS